MYEPEIITELNEDLENKNKCIVLGYEKIPEEKENELEFEADDDINYENNVNNINNIKKEILKKEKIKEYKNKINNKIREIDENRSSEEIIYDKDKNSIFGRTPNITPSSNYNNYIDKSSFMQAYSNYNISNKNNILTETNKSKKKNKIQFPKNNFIDNNSNFYNSSKNRKNTNFETNINNYGNNNSFASNNKNIKNNKYKNNNTYRKNNGLLMNNKKKNINNVEKKNIKDNRNKNNNKEIMIILYYFFI